MIGIPDDLMARVESYRLVLLEVNPGIRVTTSDAVRAALTMGLDAEAKAAKKSGPLRRAKARAENRAPSAPKRPRTLQERAAVRDADRKRARAK